MNSTIGPLLFGLLCIGVVFLAVAGVVALLFVNQKNSRKNREIPQNWIAITARITAASVEEDAGDEDNFYYPLVEFIYTVEGQAYTGKHAVGRPSNITLKARQTLKNYPVGSDVGVYYNPENPTETRLSLP